MDAAYSSRRSVTTSNGRKMFYMWQVLKFFNGFEDHMEVLMEILMSYANHTASIHMALLLRALCSAGNRHFKASIEPPLADNQGISPPPLVACLKDKLAWAFNRCHFCLKSLEVDKKCLSRHGLSSFDDENAYTTFICDRCTHAFHRQGHKTAWITASNTVLFDRSPMEMRYLKHILASCKVSARYVGTHRWEGWQRGRVVHALVILTAVEIDRQDGSKALKIHTPLFQRDHDAAFGKGAIRNATVNNFKPIFANVLLQAGGHQLFDRIVSWHFSAQAALPFWARPRKRATAPARLKCVHRYSKPFRGAKLKSCTFCKFTDDDDDDDDDDDW